jgi:hypothetical protein
MQTENIDTKSKTEEVKDSLGDLASHVTQYAETFYKLQVLNLTKKATDVTAGVLGAVVIGLLGVFVILFGGVALAWWLGDVVDSRAGGFLLVAGFFVLVAVILALCMKSIVFPKFRNMIIRRMYD